MKSLNNITMLLLALVMNACGSNQQDPVNDQRAILDSLAKTVQTAPVMVEDRAETIRLNGKIEPDESKLIKVYALASGKIQSVNVELGDFVQKGQVMAILKSTEVAGNSNDLAMASSNVAMAKKSMQTAKDLYEGKLATEQDYINARLNYNKALSELNKARQVASITGGSNATYTVRAPLNGYVIEKNITNNTAVRPDNNSNLFAVADLSRVWVIANVYEADMSKVHLGDQVKVNTLANPNEDYLGKIDKIYNVLDPSTRTMKVRISMDNHNNELKPEMFATVKVNGQPTTKNLTIPSQAIVMDNSRNYVVVKNKNGLEVKEIELIKRMEGTAYISGLSAGDLVVINSPVFLYQSLTTQ
jgi:cobalt-zinc-cadmium efflux system membrane fusion protein